MKKTLLILSFILLSVVSFAQRQRTTAMFDADTTTRPKAGFYGIGVRANNIYFVPPTGNNIRLANYSLFTGLSTNYLLKWNGSKLVNSGVVDEYYGIKLRINSIGDVGIGSGASYGNFYVNETRTTGDRHAFEDWSALSLTDSNLGYCSFDAKPTITNANNYQHYVGFQSRLIYNGSGNVTDYVHGYDTDITHGGSGTISSLAGIRIRDVKGSGTITNNYGLYINDIVRGGTNYAIFSNGGQSYHKGSFGIGAAPISKLHVSTTVVLGSINTSFDDVLIENTDNAGLTIRSNDNSLSGIRFNSPSSSIFGYGLITADYTNAKMQIGTNIAGGKLEFLTDGFNVSAMNITSSGNVGIGTSSPTSKLQVVGLPTYADNTTAISGGLTAGAFYRTSTGVLMVVY